MQIRARWFNAQECGGVSTKMSKFCPEGFQTQDTLWGSRLLPVVHTTGKESVSPPGLKQPESLST
ncbi:MAG: hypothetical protein ACK6AT_05960 [Planctomycetota bacterium]